MTRTSISRRLSLASGRNWAAILQGIILCSAVTSRPAYAQTDTSDHAGRVPLIEGGAGYIHNVSGGVPVLEPQIDPVLLVPFGGHVLLESRTDFTGFFQREQQTSGPFKGKVFKTVEFAQLDWLAAPQLIAVAGRYLLPFGLYNERLEPIWIRNLQDPPLTATIGTRTSGAGDGFMLRGPALQMGAVSLQYSVYGSAHSGINQIGAARAAGFDASVYVPRRRLEIGTSYQRFLESRRVNNAAAYLAWQTQSARVDVKAEWDRSYFGRGYWVEAAWNPWGVPGPRLLRDLQLVARQQQVLPFHGGGNGLPSIRTEQADIGLNYYLRDDLRLVSSYGRSLTRTQNLNIWNAGVTYRFAIPLWFGGKR